MVFDITQLRKIRKQLDMTQHPLAGHLGVSQSMVAKIESGRLDPTRERTKVMRGFHGRIESAYAIMKGLEINYNFNRKHMALTNKTPVEIAISNLGLYKNSWLDLIKLSKL